MKTPVVPSADALRLLRSQTDAFHHPSITLSLISRHPRRHLSTSTKRRAKPQASFIDDLWPRHRDGCKALPPPRYPPPRYHPPLSSHPRHASGSANEGWLKRLFRHRQSKAKANNVDHTVPFENSSYEDTSAQLFNLSRALSRNPSGADLKLRCTEFDSNGSVTLVAGEFKKSELIAKYGLLPRDLRKIDSSVLPHILVRSSAILINLLHLRVLIQSDRVLVFDAYGSTDSYTQSLFMYDLEGKLRQKADPRNPSANLPYEFRALEAVLISVTSGLEAEFALVRDPVTHILRELEEDIDREKLRHLLISSKKLGTFEQKARLVRDAIDDLLNADDDLAAMYLTERRATSSPRTEDDHQEVEMLLESYHKICDEIVEISGNLISNIRNTEEVVKAILDANRNQLMLLDLKFSIGTLGLAGGTLIAGLYGMNLENFIEETNWGFGSMTVVCFGLTAIISAYGMRKLRKMQKVKMWGESIESRDRGRDGRRAQVGSRGNWMNEALESHAQHSSASEPAWKAKYARPSHAGSGGPVLWPGMEGLGMHKLAGTEGLGHSITEPASGGNGNGTPNGTGEGGNKSGADRESQAQRQAQAQAKDQAQSQIARALRNNESSEYSASAGRAPVVTVHDDLNDTNNARRGARENAVVTVKGVGSGGSGKRK